jgi:colanic acid/amylovoran biosynthesis glycosyltransferase
MGAVSETFIRAHNERLPGAVTVVHTNGTLVPHIGNRPVLSQSVLSLAWRKAARLGTARPWEWEITQGYLAAFRECGATVVLAEYGTTGVAVWEACQIANLPLVVHFHGCDASKHDVLRDYTPLYAQMFDEAAAIVAVSTAMRNRLISIGAPAFKTHLNVYGVDGARFGGATPEQSGPTLLAVGRFVEKKAPHLTLLAFAKVFRQRRDARLRMIGEGSLLGPCRDLACGLGIDSAVSFLGAQAHDVVAKEMQSARAFVQHSVEASDGDCEGTPVAVLEAGASGLPVVATRHAGIPDVVEHERTGLLVEEKDVAGMAEHMLALIESPEQAGSLGRNAREHILSNFSMDKSIARLWAILQAAASNTPLTSFDAKRKKVTLAPELA